MPLPPEPTDEERIRRVSDRDYGYDGQKEAWRQAKLVEDTEMAFIHDRGGEGRELVAVQGTVKHFKRKRPA